MKKCESDAATAMGAIKLNVGEVDRHLARQPTALGIAAVGLEVLVHLVDALDDDLAGDPVHAQHPAALAAVVAANHFDGIVHADVHSFSSRGGSA